MTSVEQLLAIMARLRDPETGCPWDRAQTYATIVPHTLEEAYEVAEAIERGDLDELQEELGDLLFQVVFYAQIAREEGRFEFEDVARGICEKMIRRHPHVFSDANLSSEAERSAAWERIKAQEKAARGERLESALDGINRGLPGLTRAVKLQRKAARVGFDWPELAPVLAKIEEELEELKAEIREDAPRQRMQEELGDLLFACANLARHLDIDPEQAIRGTIGRFEGRFRHMEAELARQGRSPAQSHLDEMDTLWEMAKHAERKE